MTQAKPAPETERSYVASIRTALSGPEDGIMKKLPKSYVSGSVRSVLNYLVNNAELSGEELVTSQSVKSEMQGDYTVAVNGKTAKPSDNVSALFEEKTHRGVSYQALEMEIASVQEGGLVYLLN